jgi:hypothetical protein
MRAFPATLCWLTLLAAGLCSCFVPFEVECGVDAHCDRFPGGLCHTNPLTERRWCSYPDPACSTGYRYSDLDVGDGVSAACTGEPPARCNPTAEFSEPVLVPNINSSFDDSMSMSRDELTVYIQRVPIMLLASTRRSTAEEFPPPTIDPTLAAVISAEGTEYLPSLSADGRLLYFHRQISPGAPRMFVAARASQGDAFDEGSLIAIGSYAPEAALGPAVASDGQVLYWNDYYDFTLRAAARTNSHRNFTEQRIASTMNVSGRAFSADELTLYYSRGLFAPDIYVTTRTSKTIPFETGVLVPNVNSTEEDQPLFLSTDGCLLYLASNRSGGLGGFDIWVTRRPR